ncbi:MAG TPA: hypothetical protein ENK04_07145 [Gammaproteobacteria bacterium]|nr:hypothetical protein [Gammaproteobacteria bacterium]
MTPYFYPVLYAITRRKPDAKWLCTGLAVVVLCPALVWALPHNTTQDSFVQRVVNFNGAALAEQRTRFLAAEKALRLRRVSEFHRLSSTLTDYPLYPYLQYQDIKRRLHKIPVKKVSAFLEQYQSLPVSRSLRHKLLRQLARQGRWQQYLDFYTPTKNIRLQCHYLYALIRTGQAEAAYPDIKKLWLTGRSQPRTCDRTFKHWKAAGKLTTELVWQRMALALDKGRRTLARYLLRYLPAKDQKLARLWIKLHRKPHLLPRYQQQIARSTHHMASRLFVNVVKRLARRTPREAEKIWFDPKTRHIATETEQYEILQQIAIALARKQLPGSEAWFSIIPDEYLSDTARQWRVRTALLQAQWSRVLTALDALTPRQQASDRWQYWRARAHEELGETAAAMTQFTALARQRSYYGFLSADRLNLPYTIADRPHKTSAGTLFTIGQRPAVQRAHEFVRLGRMVEARREWHSATQHMTNNERVDAAKLAQHWGWAEQSILTMASTDQRDDLTLRFPLLFQEQILNYSEREDINPAWTYGVIRRESAFVQDARSPKGALGLMQLMPATAKHISRSLPKKYRGKSKLTQADINLSLGTRYLRKMLKRFGGQTVLATAAYNAGENRIMRWLPAETTLDAERWIENIPFRETREYVTSVLAFTIIYADRLGFEQKRLSQHMSAVPTRETL